MILSKSKRLSLWLLPPQPIATELSTIQNDIIASHSSTLELPTFLPHVTLIGGVPISECATVNEVPCNNTNDDIDEDAAKVVLQRLQDAFRSFGGVSIECVPERGVFAARALSDDGIVQWNQSCVSITKRTEDFMKAMHVAEKALFPNESLSIERHFKPPLFEPHYSYVYGNDPDLIPPTLNCPPPFKSTEMVVMWTYPSNLEGVKEWKEIGRVSMV